MNTVSLCFTLWLAILCGCQAPNRGAPPSTDPGKLKLGISISQYDLRTELDTARIYVDESFAGHYAEGWEVQLPAGKHKIAVQIARAAEIRQQNDGTTRVRYFKLAGEETITVFGGQSAQNVLFDLGNLNRTEIDIDDPH